jgi:Icc-related predicted phosphoesterase
MRLLAFSDIHHNLMAVRKLRALEDNDFDALIVAGDIGNESAVEFFEIVRSFECPVLYVYGNWDHKLSYEASFGRNCHLVHSNVTAIGDFYFTGFSGCPTNWGRNPIAQRLERRLKRTHKPVLEALSYAESLRSKQTNFAGKQKAKKQIEKIKATKAFKDYDFQMRSSKSEVLRLNRKTMGSAVRQMGVDPRRCVVITHERLARLSEELPGTLLHVFGHIHRFSDQHFKGTRFIDVAALDRPVAAGFRTEENSSEDAVCSLDAGNYVVIEISPSLAVEATCVPLQNASGASMTGARVAR